VRSLTAQEAQAAEPLRIRLVRAAAGDSFDSLARRMTANDGFERERFRIINGMREGEAPVAGRLYKIVAER